MAKLTGFLVVTLFITSGCLRPPGATINDEYVEVNKPGYILGILEINPLVIDSEFHYPIEEEIVSAYTVIDRRTKKNDNSGWTCQNMLQ